MVQNTNIIGLTLEHVSHWPAANYVDPPRQEWMPVYASILYIVGTFMAVTRVWLRATKQAGGLWWDDVCMFLAWLGSTMFMIVVIIATQKYDADRAIWNIHIDKYEGIAFAVFLLEMSFLWTQACVKVSILLLYYRLVDGKFSFKFLVAIYVGIITVIVYSITYILVIVFACSPTAAWWKAFNFTYEATARYHCISTSTTWLNVSCGIFAGGTDLYVIFLPWFMSSSLGLPKRQLFILNFVFSLGFLATIASGFRTYYLYEVGAAFDITGNLFKCFVWAYLELQLGIICANAPAFRVFFRKYIVAPVKRNSYISQHMKSQLSTNDADEMALRRTASNISTLKQPDSSLEIEDDKVDPRLTVTKTGRIVMTSTEDCIGTPMSEEEERVEHVVRTPLDYEAYNMRTIEMSRQIVSARQSAHAQQFG